VRVSPAPGRPPEWLEPAETARNIAWARHVYDAMRPYAAGASYVNYMSHDERENPAEVAYGPTLARLRGLKTRYDPECTTRAWQALEGRRAGITLTLA
jgi:hypothetical protein